MDDTTSFNDMTISLPVRAHSGNLHKMFNSSFNIEPNRVILGIHGGFQGVGVKRPLFIDIFNSLVSDCRQSLLPVAGMKFRSSREFLNECG